nr:amidohydrolase family protein [Brucepastera parasyntrophica]
MSEPLYAEAVRVENGVITSVGTSAELLKTKNKNVRLVDLKGKTLMPGFIDAHSHLIQFAQSLSSVDLSSAKNFDDIVQLIKKYIDEIKPEPGTVITGSGYDHNFLDEKKHPDKTVLDKASTDYPIIIAHASGHMGVVNSKALELMGINKDTPDVEGGIIARDDTGNPTGYLEEKAFMNYSMAAVKPPAMDEMIKLVDKASDIYLSYGTTTVQEALMGDMEFGVLNTMAGQNRLKVDVIGFVDLKNAKHIADENKNLIGSYTNRFKIGGYKIFLDGSPRGKRPGLQNLMKTAAITGAIQFTRMKK